MKGPLQARSCRRHAYAVEKLATAIRCLATHPGDVRERLIAAHLCFHTLQERDFPPEHIEKWKSVMKELTKFGPLLDYKGEPWRGSVENTMKKVRNRTGVKIAEAIYDLYWSLSENTEYV